jgi:Chalcone isomerase-like
MPEKVSVSSQTAAVERNRCGQEGIFQIYVIALYLESPTSDARNAIKADEAKRIVLTMLRDVSRERFVQAVEEDMERNPGVPMSALRGRLDRLESVLPALKKGSTLDFTYLPLGGTLVRGQGREITIPGKDFADALFSVWLSPQSSNPALQQQLLGGA